MRRLGVFLLGCGVVGCSDRPATAVVAAIASDQTTAGLVGSVRIRAYRGAQLRRELVVPATTLLRPGTLTLRDTSDGDSSAPLRIVIDGLMASEVALPRNVVPGQVDKDDPAVLVRRTAQMRFVREKSKLLRLGLSASCLGVPCNQASQTCKAGACVDEVEPNPEGLPDAPDELEGLPLDGFGDLPEVGGAGGSGGGPIADCVEPPDGQLYVDPVKCDAARLCATPTQPTCTVGQAIQVASSLLDKGQSGLTLHVAPLGPGQAYNEYVRLPAGVSLVGGEKAGGAVGSRTLIRPPVSAAFDLDPLAIEAGQRIRSTLTILAPRGADPGETVLHGLTVEMASANVVTDAQAVEELNPYITTSIHAHGAARVRMESTDALPGIGPQGPASLNEHTVGVLQTGAGKEALTVLDSRMTPPLSRHASSHGLWVYPEVQGTVAICSASILAGGGSEAPGASSTGARIQGSSLLAIQHSAACPASQDPAPPAPQLRGGIALRAHGLRIEAPTQLRMGASLVEGVHLAENTTPTWPQSPDATTFPRIVGLSFDPVVTRDIEINGATVIGLSSNGQNAPSEATLIGLEAEVVPTDPGQTEYPSFPPDFSMKLTAMKVYGQRGTLQQTNDCADTKGMRLFGSYPASPDKVAKVTIAGGLFAGGEACRHRVGISDYDFDLDLVKLDVEGTQQPVLALGSSNNKGEGCDTAIGLLLDSGLNQGLTVQGGRSIGGSDCFQRFGISARGTGQLLGVEASGSESPQAPFGHQLAGLELSSPPPDTATLVTQSTLVGGPISQLDASDSGLQSVGALLTDSRAELTGNVIKGCTSVCEGNVRIAGVRVDRSMADSTSYPVTLSGNTIVGAATMTSASGASIEGLVVQGYNPNGSPSVPFKALNLNVLVKPQAKAILTIDNGNVPMAAPLRTSGVTILGGGVTLDGDVATPLQIQSSPAIERSSGLVVCPQQSDTDHETCATFVARYLQVTAGAAPRVTAVSVRDVDDLQLSALEARSLLSATETQAIDAQSLLLEGRITGIVANSYLFGPVLDSAVAPSFEGSALKIAPDQQSSRLLIAHNAIIAGRSPLLNAAAVGLDVYEGFLAEPGSLLQIDNNLLGAQDPGSYVAIDWRREPSKFQSGSMQFQGNRFFATSQPLHYYVGVQNANPLLKGCGASLGTYAVCKGPDLNTALDGSNQDILPKALPPSIEVSVLRCVLAGVDKGSVPAIVPPMVPISSEPLAQDAQGRDRPTTMSVLAGPEASVSGCP